MLTTLMSVCGDDSFERAINPSLFEDSTKIVALHLRHLQVLRLMMHSLHGETMDNFV